MRYSHLYPHFLFVVSKPCNCLNHSHVSALCFCVGCRCVTDGGLFGNMAFVLNVGNILALARVTFTCLGRVDGSSP